MTAPATVRALQVVTLRMLHDAAFRAEVYRDPGRALAGLGLPTDAAAWLAAVDPRAWEVDPMRNARLLTAILEACPATGLALAEAGWRLPKLHTFFASDAFHASLAAWGTLVDAFHVWIAQQHPPSGHLAALEAAIAAARRDLAGAPGLPKHGPAAAPGQALRVARGVAVVLVAEGTLGRYSALRRTLARHGGPAGEAAAVARALSGPQKAARTKGAAARPTRGLAASEGLAIVAGLDTSVREVGEGVVGLVRWLRGSPSATRADALGWLVAEGLPAEEAGPFLDELVGDGVLATT
jgi:hypothetical protein